MTYIHPHECCDNAKVFVDQATDSYWYLDLDGGQLVISHCPWCGAKLEQTEDVCQPN